MARKEKMITRTIEGTKATFILFDMSANKTVEDTLILSGTLSIDECTKYARKTIENDILKVVTCKSVEPHEKMYGMTEACFIQNAIELDSVTRKPLAKNTENTEVQTEEEQIEEQSEE